MSTKPFRLNDSTEDAYRVIGELQVNLRKVLERAMRRKYGDSWFKKACPPEVFERLIARKEAELLVDRCSTEYQELMFYSNFHDMAEIVAGCAGVVGMFKRLASSAEALIMCLEILEESRVRLDLAHAVDDEELEELLRLQAGFNTFVRQATVKGQPQGEDAGPAPWDEQPARPVGKLPVADSDPASPARPGPADTSPSGAPVTPRPEPVESWGIEGALVVGDKIGIFEALRHEITAFAEGFYGTFEDRPPVVWQALRMSEWWVKHAHGPDFDNVQRFYDVLETYQAARDAGSSAEELSDLLAKRGLPTILIDLRRLFRE